jgi:long-chain fatty acid transport protein
MAKRYTIKKLMMLMAATGAIGLNQTTFAAAFQLWEQDAASIGNYHAGSAVTAEDASTNFYNPAGLTKIKNQQFVIGGDSVLTNFKYNGDITVTDLSPTPLEMLKSHVSSQGGGYNFVPFLHYAAPISERVVFGLSVTVPFGLKTDYGTDTDLKYAAILSQLKVIDFGPSLGVAINDRLSVGAGIDVQRASGDFNQYAVLFDPAATATLSQNTVSGTAWGYHLGFLYQITDTTRLGVNYRSQVVHHLKGNSTFTGPLANSGSGGTQYTNQTKVNATLPPITTLSILHNVNPQWDIMGSVTYIQWNVFRDLVLQNVAGIDESELESNNVVIRINEGFRNAWNFSVGANYHPNETWIFRTGIGYDETPTRNQFRNVQLPDSSRIAVAFGGHYQATQTIGFDAGWTHLFVMNTRVNNLVQKVGAEEDVTNGSVSGSADVIGFQIKWDIV